MMGRIERLFLNLFSLGVVAWFCYYLFGESIIGAVIGGAILGPAFIAFANRPPNDRGT